MTKYYVRRRMSKTAMSAEAKFLLKYLAASTAVGAGVGAGTGAVASKPGQKNRGALRGAAAGAATGAATIPTLVGLTKLRQLAARKGKSKLHRLADRATTGAVYGQPTLGAAGAGVLAGSRKEAALNPVGKALRAGGRSAASRLSKAEIRSLLQAGKQVSKKPALPVREHAALKPDTINEAMDRILGGGFYRNILAGKSTKSSLKRIGSGIKKVRRADELL